MFALVFGGIGVLAILFRKNIGGNIAACYIVTNKRAYIFDGHAAVRAFNPQQIFKMKCLESAQFEGAGDLIFAYDFMGQEGVMVDKETAQKNSADAGQGNQASTPVGFLNIENVQTVRKMMHEVLIDPVMKKVRAQKKAKKQERKDKEKERKRFKPFG